MPEQIPNILAERYASEAMQAIWSPAGRIRLERELWIAVMRAQAGLGLDIPQADIEAYERVKDTVDLEAIQQREAVTRHDVKARIEAFCELAGCEHIHKGMTSRDLTENVEQLQLFRSLLIVREKAAGVLLAFGRAAAQWRDLVLAGRTHNVAAQNTTFGKRLACYGEELAHALGVLDRLIEHMPVRGLKGAVGTQMDALTLLEGDRAAVGKLETAILEHLGLPAVCTNVGQVYPRSYDYELVSTFFQLASGPANFARTLRLMAGHETATEGFAKGQVGSSAMPHKMNARSCERINGFHAILFGHVSMLSRLAGDQWNEGDVSCSVVRRVALPDACLALDGLLETTAIVLEQMAPIEGSIAREHAHYLPFLLTTTVLMEAVRQGAGREEAHEAIKEHAVATVEDLRAGRVRENDLINRLLADKRLGLDAATYERILEDGRKACGMAGEQVDAFVASLEPWKQRFPEAEKWRAGPIL